MFEKGQSAFGTVIWIGKSIILGPNTILGKSQHLDNTIPYFEVWFRKHFMNL